MSSLRGFLFGTLLLFGLGFALDSCSKEVDASTETQCECLEQHEVLEPVNVGGMPSLQWVLDYETPAETNSCSLETGEYIYQGQTNRFKTTCY
jgi:hypothetical protein